MRFRQPKLSSPIWWPLLLCVVAKSIEVDQYEHTHPTIKPKISPSQALYVMSDVFFKTQHSGPIDDATCHVEQLEYANDSQLYSILYELKNTAFFRNFAVDLDTLCPLHRLGGKKEVQHIPLDKASSSSESSETQNSDFTCSGGTVAHEIDDESPPLCQLNGASPFEQKGFPARDMFSKALNNLNKGESWESELQKETFDWSSISDPVVTSLTNSDSCEDSHIEGKLPDSFWLDMCSSISAGSGLKIVNLALNPERNTGYNGTHIWRAIYEENCIVIDGIKDEPMCYEERVLYRLFSGLHASTTLSIAMNYYPPNKRKGRDGYEPNPSFFMEKFSEHPDYIHNLYFSYVVLLRALKKASPYLYTYAIQTGNIVEDETATILLRRLLDSSILSSCNHVFSAFDESLMFQNSPDATLVSKQDELISLQKTFKGIFHNVSSILDCVQCQQCKLHGKLAMLGYGTALKILFLSRQDSIASSLNRNEIVALINTIAKFSEALKHIRDLTSLFWMDRAVENGKDDEFMKASSQAMLVDTAIGTIAQLARSGKISSDREIELINLALNHDNDLLSLTKYYSVDIDKFLLLTKAIGALGSETMSSIEEPDAIVIGTGLAGLTAALNILDRGGKVVLIEKEHRMGGNSNKASSGINACCFGNNTTGDSIPSFLVDTTKSAGISAKPELIRTLVENSAAAVEWLKDRVGVDLSLIAQLGGHQHERTHRPQSGMVGAEIIYGMQKAVKAYEQNGKVKILMDTQVKRLLTTADGAVNGVEVKYLVPRDKSSNKIMSSNIVLATGGFAADRSSDSYLAQYRPELIKMPATAGSFSTGDGISLATGIGADLVDMEKIQIHPTGWVDPVDPSNPNKILAAELMRGVGGILLNKEGKRFCNELGTRAYVTDKMLSHDPYYNSSKMWNVSREIPIFSLILSSSAAKDGQKHVEHYVHKGLLRKLDGLTELARWLNISVSVLQTTLSQYIEASFKGVDEWGKITFKGVPGSDLHKETFYAGFVTPVLHYCMGGITIDIDGSVLNRKHEKIRGLFAVGEVTGGVHGDNRLGGNSLLECTVFGTKVGQAVPIKHREMQRDPAHQIKVATDAAQVITRTVSFTDLSSHNQLHDCWVCIHGVIYDLTEFAEEHPGGPESIHSLCGKDGTKEFDSIHSKSIMDDFDEVRIGNLLL